MVPTGISQIIFRSFLETMKIVGMVILLMILIEFLELRFKDKIREKITSSPLTQYVIASLLGAIPGCMDAFFIVSLYIHGIVGFGALTAEMLSTAGDEAYVMLALIPRTALVIFALCALLGVVGGFLADGIVKRINLRTCESCEIKALEEGSSLSLGYFLREHLLEHIVRRHLVRLFLWIFLTLVVVSALEQYLSLETFISSLPRWLLIVLAAVVGIVPESGPHLLFVVMYSKGLIPFSVLFVNTLSQDGHGLLPLLSYSVKDTVYVQIFTTLFALMVGVVILFLGL